MVTSDAHTTNNFPCQIIINSVSETTEEFRPYLPSTKAQRCKINRVRSKNNANEPVTLNDIQIPEEVRTVDGEIFVLSENVYEEGEKNIILGTKSSLLFLSRCDCWIMDGTFHVVPVIFRQLFSIHGVFNNEIVPLVFCIMSSKSKKAYQDFFYQLLKIAADWNIHLNPKRIISDFEKTISTAAKEFFPSTSYKGCLFHFGQIIWRQVQKHHLVSKYGIYNIKFFFKYTIIIDFCVIFLKEKMKKHH